jgi:hypothetical protein
MDLMSKGISTTFQCNVKNGVINYDYSEKIGLIEKILVHVLIFGMVKTSSLNFLSK